MGESEPPEWRTIAGAWVHVDARIGADVTIGPGTLIHADASIGARARIGAGCIIGEGEAGPLTIGADAIIRSHTVIYAGSRIGEGLETGHGAVIRERTIAGANLRVGIQSVIQGDCTIGDYCRFHTAVEIGKGSTIGDFVWMFPQVVLTNDPLPPSDVQLPCVVEDGAVISTGAILMPGTRLGAGAFVSAGAIVSGNVAACRVVGRDGEDAGDMRSLIDLRHRIRHPWMGHFRRGYPDEAVPRIEALGKRLREHQGEP